MFLKRLDTIGFKSFAERVTVDFVPGVTSVVGPNGSGKSNITDAIRWVLGEQSARSLRGSKMEDIIFAGSDTRNALNMAEVTLTLDNEDQTLPLDYQEVSVTRRVYRSGESAFYINKQPCRLKDIVDLFMDSGLGREAFSIISQGKVEEILSSKAEERRSIFEEAAGVLKYKQRKKKAEYKLAETQENLNRVEDIIHEIEGQLEPLKEQAAIAKDYLEKKEELKHVEISLLIAQIETLNNEWQDLLDNLEEMKVKEAEIKAAIEEKESVVEKERDQVLILDESIEKLQEKLLTLTQELENLEGKKQLVKEQFKHFEENKVKLEEEFTQLSSRLEQTKAVCEKHEAELKERKKQQAETRKAYKETTRQLELESQDIGEQIEELKGDYIELLNEQAAKRNEKQSVSRQLDQIGSKSEVQRDKFKDMREERERLIARKEEIEQEVNQISEQRVKKEKQLAALEEKLNTSQTRYQELQSKLYQGYQYVEKLKSKKEMLEEMKEDFSGYFQGVKEVLKAREQQYIQGIEGAVLELIDVPGNLITSIETALGAQAQHVIMTNEAAARQAIHWLRQHNKGRATFLPLETIQPRFIPADMTARINGQPGFVGVAADLVDFGQQYDRAIRHLLGHIVIAEDLETANKLAQAMQRRFRIVTLEGDVINPGGAMTGGAKKKTNQSLFTRERELQELHDKLSSFEQKTRAAEQEMQQLKQMNEDQKETLQELRASKDNLKEQEQEKRAVLREVQVKHDNVNDQLVLFDQDQEQYEQDRDQLKARLADLAVELEDLEVQLTKAQQQIDTLTETEKRQSENKESLKARQHELQVKLTEQDSDVKYYQEKWQGLREQKAELEQSLEENRQQYSQLMDIANNKQTEAELEASIQDKKSDKEETAAQIASQRHKRNEHAEHIKQKDQELKEQNRTHHHYVQDIQDKEVKANRMDVELENMLGYLQKEYFLTFERAQQEYERATDINTSTTKVKLIKRAIEELGTVNLGAIDEFDRIQERYQFLKDQQADLNEAKDTLYSVISEMDGEMHRRFEETFTQIKQEFSVVFTELFGGGRADLRLTDPDNMLETGVDIVAQPPGKKLQNLSLLSGGERALTAIALLFAILRVRPVPFCVLDEVEAALDDANVDRFARYLKVFSEKTQFIVITHRKGTMEESDVLYGVTMQESGVSKLVSVRLEESADLLGV
ncbi:chromosome partition protein Smc [Thalassobacillus devorans]|uniref:Chromosome partition protein Smc n=1 Tax=Thalassobacillus devorans TaxID=279813 RepID=A0ABQ1P469_9BACI|nr:chromosome segregation protein SMC [Thalassobacillus devorans]NIK27883.1 chromosome segregation protein [Thalassobacillus devorans]GGC90613.1 chromosome partition protein Smc [Thalassobacillus devorans]